MLSWNEWCKANNVSRQDKKEIENVVVWRKNLKYLQQEKALKMTWLENANFIEKVYDAFVNYEEEFYICPECGEPVYIGDWSKEELNDMLCPICGLINESLE